MKQLFSRKQFLVVALLVANGLYFTLMNPESSKSLVLFLGFLLLAIDFFLLFKLLLRTIAVVTGRRGIVRNRLAGLATLIVIILLALQSIGQLSVRDTVAVVCIGAIFWFYSTYYRFGHRG